MHNKKFVVLSLMIIFFLSWGFWGGNSGFNYHAQSYFPYYSTYSGGPTWHTYAYSAPAVTYERPTFTMPAYYTTFGNYQYYGRFSSSYW